MTKTQWSILRTTVRSSLCRNSPGSADNGDNGSDNDDLEPMEMPDEEIEQVALLMVDELTSHPDDPSRPPGVEGVSDDELADMDTQTVVELLELALPYATERQDEPRYLFGLGRAALMQGDEELASELLWQASELGSAGATAYLAFLTDDLNEMEEYLTSAANGGFDPAREWLQETRNALADAQPPAPAFNVDEFNLPYAIAAFHNGNTRPLAQNGLVHFAYATAINNTLTDPGILWVTDESMMLEIDAQLNVIAERKLLTNQGLQQESVNIGLGALTDMFVAMAETRQRGGTVMEEVHASMSAMAGSGQYSLLEAKSMGEQDARRLAIMYKTNKEDFRKVYAGLRQFILEDL